MVLRKGFPDKGSAPGTRAVILEVHSSPRLAYEAEVTDDATGETQWWARSATKTSRRSIGREPKAGGFGPEIHPDKEIE